MKVAADRPTSGAGQFPAPAVSHKPRCNALDIAKGIAIVAVVAGHIIDYISRFLGGVIPALSAAALQDGALFVHIPTFMLVAGILAGRGRRIESLAQYLQFEQNKFLRLMVPFLSVSLVYGLLKALAVPGINLVEMAIMTAIAPHGGAAGHLWFLYCLMFIFALWPAIASIGGRFPAWTTFALCVLAAAPVPWPEVHGSELLSLRRLAMYLPIFAVGYFYGGRLVADGLRRWWHVVAPAAALIIAMVVFFRFVRGTASVNPLISNGAWLVGGLAAAVLALRLGELIDRLGPMGRNVPLALGLYSYDVYLLHVAFVGQPLVLLLRRFHPDAVAAWTLYPVLIVATLAGSMLLARCLRLVPLAATILLGVPKPRAAAA